MPVTGSKMICPNFFAEKVHKPHKLLYTRSWNLAWNLVFVFLSFSRSISMCDPVVKSLIADMVGKKVANGEMFTAFDVTLEVQKELKVQGQFDATLHRHSHLKNDVHDVINSNLNVAGGNYFRSLQDVGAPTLAYVYYPLGGTPANYVPLKRKDDPVVSIDPFTITIPATPYVSNNDPFTITIPSLPDSSDGGDGVDNGRTPDARGTVCVSSALMRYAGFQCHDTAYVFQEGNRLVVAKVVPNGVTPLTTYTVDQYCNVRITKAILDYAGLGPTYDFENDPSSANRVFVSSHK